MKMAQKNYTYDVDCILYTDGHDQQYMLHKIKKGIYSQSCK